MTAQPIEPITDRAEQVLRDLCAISSESGNASGIREVADLLSREFERHGLTVTVKDEPDANGVLQPVLIARGPSSGGAHLLLLGHLDTVLPATEPQLDGRTLFATGALDMKGGLAMLVGALDVIASRGDVLPGDLLVVLVPDEESESFISGEAARKWSEGARGVLVLEPGMATPRGETLVAGRRGLLEWKLEMRGRASHSGLAYWSGRSALAAAADFCAKAQALSERATGPTVNVGRIVGGGADFVRDLGRQHTMLGSSRQLNVVSDLAVAEGEMRFLTTADCERMLQTLRELAESVAKEHETEVTFTPGMRIEPVDPQGPGAPLIRRAVELAAQRGFHLEVEEDRGGVSFPNFIADPSRTPVIDGLGPTGDGMHVRGEYLSLDSLARRIVLLADLLPTL